MSFPIIQSAGNTINKTLGMADSLIDGTSYVGKIYKVSMEQAYRETLKDNMLEQNKTGNAEGLTEEQKAILAGPL